MSDAKTPLEKILMILGVFHLEKRKWPLDATELQTFAVELGNPLDFSTYHRFRFIPRSVTQVTLDFCLWSKNEWTLGGQAEVRIQTEAPEAGHTLPLEVKIQSLAPQKMETKSYCLLEEARLTGKKSA
ncbi:MAG TPA: hypothetical protein VMV05_01935 [bacterium]|nr:hypothetical protein [bacterium]